MQQVLAHTHKMKGRIKIERKTKGVPGGLAEKKIGMKQNCGNAQRTTTATSSGRERFRTKRKLRGREKNGWGKNSKKEDLRRVEKKNASIHRAFSRRPAAAGWAGHGRRGPGDTGGADINGHRKKSVCDEKSKQKKPKAIARHAFFLCFFQRPNNTPNTPGRRAAAVGSAPSRAALVE